MPLRFRDWFDAAGGPMLTISERRKAAELRHAHEMGEVERAWRRKIHWFWVRYGVAYGSGLALIGFSFHATSMDIARTSWEMGFFVAIVAPLAVVVDFWWREMR